MVRIVFFVFWLIAFVLIPYHEWIKSDTKHFYDDSLLKSLWTTIHRIALYLILHSSLDVLYFFEKPYLSLT